MATLRESVAQTRFQPPTYEQGPESYLQPVANAPGRYWNPKTQTFMGGTTAQPRTTRATGRSYPIGGRRVAARTTITERKPTRPIPTAPTIPAFKMPEWDEGKIRKLAQRKAAPQLRSLRRQMEREAGRQYENPNVKRMTLRQAMEGYGLGLGTIMSQAEAAGRAEYGQKYGREFAGAMASYNVQAQAMMASYQNAFNAYLASMQQVTQTGPSGTEPGTIGGGWTKEDFGPQAWMRFGSKVIPQDQSWKEPKIVPRG